MTVTVPDHPATTRGQPLRLTAVLFAFFAVQKFVLYGAKGYFIRPPQDFASYYLAAKGFLRGINPYDTERLWTTFGLDAGIFHPFLYPPSSLLAVMGLTVLPPRAAGLLFLVGSAGFLGVALYCFARIFFDKPWALTLAIVGFGFQPVTSTFLIGQINAIVLGLIALALFFETRQREGRAAFCVALAIALKLTPIFLLLYYALRRRHILVLKTVAWLGVLLLISLAVFGIDLHLGYLDLSRRLSAQAVPAFENQGLNGFLARLLIPSYVSDPLLPYQQLFPSIYRTSAAIMGLASLWVAARTRSSWHALSIVLCLALLVTPISWFHTFGPLYLILIILVKELLATRARLSVWAALFFIVCFFHGGTGNLTSILEPAHYRSGVRSLALSLPFFWLLSTWGLLLIAAWSASADVDQAMSASVPDVADSARHV